LLTVELKELRRNASPAAQFLRSKLKGMIRIKGSQLHIEDAKTREVKLLINKFLHHRGIEGFRVVAPEVAMLEVREIRRPVDRPVREGSPPAPSISLPYYFPSSGGGSVLAPAGKRSKRQS